MKPPKPPAFTEADRQQPFANSAEQLETADNLQELWEGLLPGFPVPLRSQFLRWTEICSDRIVTYAINRGARKALRQQETDPMTADQLGRYITGIIVNEREGNHRFTPAPTKEKTA